MKPLVDRQTGLAPTVDAVRREVVELCLALSRRGHFAGTGGNIMRRIDASLVAVTPSATDYLTLQPEDVCVLRLNDLAVVDGRLAPSVEAGLHAKLLRARPDVGCSIHTHQPLASACALIGEPLTVPATWRASLGEQVPVVGYAPSGTGWLAHKLHRAVRPDRQAYLLRNHGIVCCGADSASAMRAVDDLEQLARDHLTQRLTARLNADASARDRLAPLIELLQHVPSC